jgi:hypothetical protein
MGIKHTLGAAVAAGAETINVYCITCINSKAYRPEQALELWGSAATFPEIARRSKCSKCKRQASQAAPHWPPTSRGRGGEPGVTPKGWENVQTENPARFRRRPANDA